MAFNALGRLAKYSVQREGGVKGRGGASRSRDFAPSTHFKEYRIPLGRKEKT